MEKEVIYNRINSLKEEYLMAKIGRRSIQKDILDNINQLRKYTDEYRDELHKMEMYYKYHDYYISDYQLVMNIILRLANEKEKIYDMKEITTTDFARISDNETKQVYGKSLVIARKDVLDNIDENKLLYYDEFSHMATKIVSLGNAMVIVAPYYFESNVKPKDYISNAIRVDIKNSGVMGNISCFLQGKPIEDAICQLFDYIDINGPDFQNIDEDTLYSLIKENNKDKKLVKNK